MVLLFPHTRRGAMYHVETSAMEIRYLTVDNTVDFVLAVLTEMGAADARAPKLSKAVVDMAARIQNNQTLRLLNHLQVYYFAYYNFNEKKALWYLGLQATQPMGEYPMDLPYLVRLELAQFISFEMAATLFNLLLENKILKGKLYTMALSARYAFATRKIEKISYYRRLTTLAIVAIASHLQFQLDGQIRDMNNTVSQATVRCTLQQLFPGFSPAKREEAKREEAKKRKQRPAGPLPQVLPKRTAGVELIGASMKFISAKTKKTILVLDVDKELSDSAGNREYILNSHRYEQLLDRVRTALVLEGELQEGSTEYSANEIFIQFETKNDYLRMQSYLNVDQAEEDNVVRMDDDPAYIFFTLQYDDPLHVIWLLDSDDDDGEKEEKVAVDPIVTDDDDEDKERYRREEAELSQVFLEMDSEAFLSPEPEAQVKPPATNMSYMPVSLKRNRSYKRLPSEITPRALAKEQAEEQAEEERARKRARLEADYENEASSKVANLDDQFLIDRPIYEKKITMNIELGTEEDMAVTYTEETPAHLFNRTLYVTRFNNVNHSVSTTITESEEATEKLLNRITQCFDTLLNVAADINVEQTLLQGVKNESYTNFDYNVMITEHKKRTIVQDMANPLFYTLVYMLLQDDLKSDLKNNLVFQDIVRAQYASLKLGANDQFPQHGHLSFDTTIDTHLLFLLASRKTLLNPQPAGGGDFPENLNFYKELGYKGDNVEEVRRFAEECFRDSTIQFLTDEQNFFGMLRRFAPDWLYQYVRQAYTEYQVELTRENSTNGSRNTFIKSFADLVEMRRDPISLATLQTKIGAEDADRIEEAMEMREGGLLNAGARPVFDEHTLHVPQRINARHVGVAHFVELIMQKLLVFDQTDYQGQRTEHASNVFQQVDNLANFFFFCHKCRVFPESTTLGRLLKYTQKVILDPYILWYNEKNESSMEPEKDLETIDIFYRENGARYDLVPIHPAASKAYKFRHYEEIQRIIDKSYEEFTQTSRRNKTDDYIIFTGKDHYNPFRTRKLVKDTLVNSSDFPLETQLAVLSYYIKNHYLGGIPKEDTMDPVKYALHYHTRLQLLQIEHLNLEDENTREDPTGMSGNAWVAYYLQNSLFDKQYVNRAVVKNLSKRMKENQSELTTKVNNARKEELETAEEIYRIYDRNEFPAYTDLAHVMEHVNAEDRQALEFHVNYRKALNEVIKTLEAEYFTIPAQEVDKSLLEKSTHLANIARGIDMVEKWKYMAENLQEGYAEFIDYLLTGNNTRIGSRTAIIRMLYELIEAIVDFDRVTNGNVNDEQTKSLLRLNTATKLPLFDHTCDFWSLAIIKSICMHDSPNHSYSDPDSVVYRGLDPIMTIMPPYYLGLRKHATTRPVYYRRKWRYELEEANINRVRFHEPSQPLVYVTLTESLLNQWIVSNWTAKRDYYLDWEGSASDAGALKIYDIAQCTTGFLTNYQQAQAYLFYMKNLENYFSRQNMSRIMIMGLVNQKNMRMFYPIAEINNTSKILEEMEEQSSSNIKLTHFFLDVSNPNYATTRHHLRREFVQNYMERIHHLANFKQDGFAFRTFGWFCDALAELLQAAPANWNNLLLNLKPEEQVSFENLSLTQESRIIAGHLYRAISLCRQYYTSQVRKWKDLGSKVPDTLSIAHSWQIILNQINDPIGNYTNTLNSTNPHIENLMAKTLKIHNDKLSPEYLELLKRTEFMFKRLLTHWNVHVFFPNYPLLHADQMHKHIKTEQYGFILNTIVSRFKMGGNDHFDHFLFIATFGHVCTYEQFQKFLLERGPNHPMQYFFA